jgi:hypothetical protein
MQPSAFENDIFQVTSIASITTPALCIRPGLEVIIFCSNSLQSVSAQCEFVVFNLGMLIIGHVALSWPSDGPTGNILRPKCRIQLTGLRAHPKLSATELFLWSYLKGKVHETSCQHPYKEVIIPNDGMQCVMASLTGRMQECRCGERRYPKTLFLNSHSIKNVGTIWYQIAPFLASGISVHKPSRISAQPCTVPITVRSLHISFWQTAELYTSKECQVETFICGHSDCSSNHRLE